MKARCDHWPTRAAFDEDPCGRPCRLVTDYTPAHLNQLARPALAQAVMLTNTNTSKGVFLGISLYQMTVRLQGHTSVDVAYGGEG